jgi:SAM-dependent methyltransferase
VSAELPIGVRRDGVSAVEVRHQDGAAGSGLQRLAGAFYDQPGVFDRYISHRHDGVFSPNAVMEEPAVVAHLGEVAGLRVLDLGCGDASLGRRLFDAGCVGYLGVDASARMVAQARRILEGTAGEVRCQDVRDLVCRPAVFDVVVARLVLHYLPDIVTLLRNCRHWLASAGRLVVTVPHPVITSHEPADRSGLPRTGWEVDDYFEQGERIREWMGSTVVWHHRTVEEYVGTLHDCGFVLTALSECPPAEGLLTGHPEELRRRRRTPLFLLLAAVPGQVCVPGPHPEQDR